MQAILSAAHRNKQPIGRTRKQVIIELMCMDLKHQSRYNGITKAPYKSIIMEHFL